MRSAQIENFFALAQYKSFSQAAEYCFITQPALSKNISAMEAELGVTLFRRTSRGVELTDAGKRMYEFFRRSSSEYMDALREARDMGHVSQVIRVALMEGIDDGIFWDFLYHYRGKIPLTELNFRFSEDGAEGVIVPLYPWMVSDFNDLKDYFTSVKITKSCTPLGLGDVLPIRSALLEKI